jgi:hypothetical protein
MNGMEWKEGGYIRGYFKTRSRDWDSRRPRRLARAKSTLPTTTGMYLSLASSGPIKWNHNQESSLFQDVSPFSPEYDGRSTTTLSERIRELYLQFLWLPEV